MNWLQRLITNRQVMYATLSGLFILDLLSFFFFGTRTEGAVTTLILLVGGMVAWRVPGGFFLLAIAEAVSTSHGHALHLAMGEGGGPSLRMLLFVLALVEVFWRTKPRSLPYREWRGVAMWTGAAMAVLSLSAIVALGRGVPMIDLVKDGIGYVAWGYVLIAWFWMRERWFWERVWSVLAAAMGYVACKTLFLFFAFAHFSPVFLDTVYHWVRDTRLGEPTRQFVNAYRIFLPAQWFLIPWILFLFARESDRPLSTGERVVGMSAISALLVSLSRTFWLALGVLGLGLLFVQWRSISWKAQGHRLAQWFSMGVGSIGLIWILFAVPLSADQWGLGGDFQSFFSKRFATASTDAALDSRQKLRPVLEQAIAEHPWIGNGLGTRVTYRTSDPRYLDMHGTDLVSPLRVEWGWHDLWVKFGIVGPLFFFFAFFMLGRTLWQKRQKNPYALPALATLFALAIAHAFSPYLNHPIGAITVALSLGVLHETTHSE